MTTDYIGFSVRALWFDIIQGWRDLPNRGEKLPMWLPEKPHPLQIMANKYFWDSFCQTFVDANPGWGFNLTQANLGKASPIQLDTYKLNMWFPGIRNKYAAYNDPKTKTGLPMRGFFEFHNFTNWDAFGDKNVMSVNMDIILHLNVSMPDGTEEVAMQWYMEDYNWNISFTINRLIFHAFLHEGHVPNIRLLTCNFCDEYPLDMILYREVFNTVLSPPTLVLDTFFNPTLGKSPIPWPAELMGIAQMSEVDISFGDGYIYLGSQMSWMPMPMPEAGLAKKIWPEPHLPPRKHNERKGQ